MLHLFNFEKNDYKAAEYNWREDAEGKMPVSIWVNQLWYAGTVSKEGFTVRRSFSGVKTCIAFLQHTEEQSTCFFQK